MCGIAGFTFQRGMAPSERLARHDGRLRAMTASLHHRGPDALNGLLLDGAALGHTRLAIVDLSGGHQPMRDEATGLTVVFNGEIFNHLELRDRISAGYAFRTRSDTEVILAAFLEKGLECVDDFNGQFAFALYDPRDGSLHLGRDRFGKQPLFYAQTPEGFFFASEAKALFAADALAPALDRRALYEALHLWVPVQPRSFFEGVSQLPQGSVATLSRGGSLVVRCYWDPDLGDERVDHALTEERALEELGALLHDAVRLRLRADVPVAAYLSGGLDSSLLCALAQQQLGGTLQTFSVGFEQARYDEGHFQIEVAQALKTEHHQVLLKDAEVGALLPTVVEHAEAVLLRTAPSPLFRLSKLVRAHQTKVVLTGEGADEVFLGYDLFKETAVRAFWARQPQSRCRSRLFSRLYPYLPLSSQSPAILEKFYGIGLNRPEALDFSHQIRWTNSGRIGRFLSKSFFETVAGHSPAEAFAATVPDRVRHYRPLARAQYLELRTLLSGYLLSSQGDRMLMGNSVEGRFPFLDHRLLEFSARLPDRLKLRGLKEKYLLKRYALGRLPRSVIDRPKFPYRAPVAEALVGAVAPPWTRELLSREGVDHVGVFSGEKVEKLVGKLRKGGVPTEADNMALVAVTTTQLLAKSYFEGRTVPADHQRSVDVRAR